MVIIRNVFIVEGSQCKGWFPEMDAQKDKKLKAKFLTLLYMFILGDQGVTNNTGIKRTLDTAY